MLLTMPVVRVAVYAVPSPRRADGVNVAVLLAELYVTIPATAVVPGPCTVNVVVLIVAGFIASPKVAVSAVFGQEPLELRRGLTERTVGPATTELSVAQQPAISKIAPNVRNQPMNLCKVARSISLPNARMSGWQGRTLGCRMCYRK